MSTGMSTGKSTRLLYMVIATLPTPQGADEYIAWLQDGHIDAVVKGGAHSAMIVRLHAPDSPGTVEAGGPVASRPVRVMTQYVFPTQQVFDHYVQKHAPGLRANGLKHFGPETGVRFERVLGDIA